MYSLLVLVLALDQWQVGGNSSSPTKADLVTLEEMAAKIVDTWGEDLDIPDLDKHKILEMLNVKVLLSPNGEITLEGWFAPESDGLLSTTWW